MAETRALFRIRKNSDLHVRLVVDLAKSQDRAPSGESSPKVTKAILGCVRLASCDAPEKRQATKGRVAQPLI